MNKCAFPGCEIPIVDDKTGTILGEVCHINAQSAGGPRYDNDQSAEQRQARENLVIMCRNHHKIIDAPENKDIYTAEYLKEIKKAHEELATRAPFRDPSEAVVKALTRIFHAAG